MMKTRKILALVLSLVMVLSLCGSAFAAHLTDEVTELEAQNSDTSLYLATQGYVLLENNGALPFKGTFPIAYFGSGSETTIKGGTGSGDVNQRAHDNIGDAFIAAGYEVANPTWYAKMAEQVQQRSILGARPKLDMEITDEELAEAVANADTAIYTVSRNAGEGADRDPDTGFGAYNLSELERTNLEKIAASFENVIVVLNTCVIDTSWAKEIDNIDAVIYMSNGGQRGGEALRMIMTGEVSPSGKLTDTFPLSYSDYPSYAAFSNNDGNTATEWYTDGIYVGYRYFDTFGLDVAYPFGYGLSYTDFGISVVDVTADADKVTVTAAVTNIGSEYAGKEVVEVYFSAPQIDIEKPYQELAAYGKTDELAPGETQTLTVSFDTADMSSYSEAQAGYVMEAGDYIIRVGNSSRSTVAAAVITLDETVVTEQLSNQLRLEEGANLTEISNEGAEPIANNDDAELADAVKISLAASSIETKNNASPYDDETATTYLFAEDEANYTKRETTTIINKARPGILENNTDGEGYMTTTYSEEIVIVPELPEGITKESAKLTDVIEGRITMEQFIACLTIDEMANICTGEGRATSSDPSGIGVAGQKSSVIGGAGQSTRLYVESRHIPGMPNADGPAGLRIQQHYTQDGVDYYQFCTAFPVGTCIAMTWDVDAINEFGKAIGTELYEYGVTSWLAPGMNLHRNPLCGRNFEYYSEDPLITGMTAAYTTAGVQTSPGIGVTLKHFWGNSQEANRKNVNDVMSERAAREIYLKGFEIAVKLAQPLGIMNSYNEVNGWSTPDSYDTNTDILRGEWGYKGFVMTDWSSTSATEFIAMHAGDNLIMPGGFKNLITEGLVADPTFNEDGSIADARSFVPDADGEQTYTVPVTATAFAELPETVQAAVEAGQASFTVRASKARVTWYGYMDTENKIYLGDLQKSAMTMLNICMQSKDMVKLYADVLGKEYTVEPYSAANGAPLADEEYVPMTVKGDVEKAAMLVAAKVEKTAEVPVTYEGEDEITTARLVIDCDLPVASIESANDYEFNKDTGAIIVYKSDGTAVDPDLFTVVFDIEGVESGTYPVDLTVIEVTDADGEIITAVAADGQVKLGAVKGDVNGDGAVDNRDLIMIARYLVDLVEFDNEQMEIADYNEDGNVNNTDLVLIARAIVAK